MNIITQKEKDDLILLSAIKGCFLNGKPALIKGRLLPFATVTQFDTLLQASWSWQAVKRIMNKTRCFVS